MIKDNQAVKKMGAKCQKKLTDIVLEEVLQGPVEIRRGGKSMESFFIS